MLLSIMLFKKKSNKIDKRRTPVQLTFAGFALGRPDSIIADQFEEARVADVAVDSHFFAVGVGAPQSTCVEI